MKLRGLSKQLESFLREKDWFAKGYLTADIVWKHDIGVRYGKRYLPETVGRALRHLESQSVIAVKDDGISVQYKWLPINRRPQYIPWSSRPDGTKYKLFQIK